MAAYGRGLAVLACLASLVAAGAGEAQWPTPEVHEIVVLKEAGTQIYGMRAELGSPVVIVGLALVCDRRESGESLIDVYFGGFPRDRRPVQLAVRTEAGRVERFGGIVAGGRGAGFHSPRLVREDEMLRFMDVSLKAGSLISNGYRSFWNRVSTERNAEVREQFTACLRREAVN